MIRRYCFKNVTHFLIPEIRALSSFNASVTCYKQLNEYKRKMKTETKTISFFFCRLYMHEYVSRHERTPKQAAG